MTSEFNLEKFDNLSKIIETCQQSRNDLSEQLQALKTANNGLEEEVKNCKKSGGQYKSSIDLLEQKIA